MTGFEFAEEIFSVLNPTCLYIFASLPERNHRILPFFLAQVALVTVRIENDGRRLAVYSKYDRLAGFFHLLEEFGRVPFENTEALDVST